MRDIILLFCSLVELLHRKMRKPVVVGLLVFFHASTIITSNYYTMLNRTFDVVDTEVVNDMAKLDT